MVESEYSENIYRSLNISIGTVKRNPQILQFVLDHLNENGGTLKYVPDCYKNQEICNKAVNNLSHALEFVPECYKTQLVPIAWHPKDGWIVACQKMRKKK